MLFDDKIVLVTGGAQGLGLAFAEEFLENNAKVSFCDVNNDTGSQTLNILQGKYGEDRVMFQTCDVTNQEAMADFFKSTKSRLGGLDIVINNAGIGDNITDWGRTIDVNLKGMINGTFLALEHLKTDNGGNGGVIINVASAAGLAPNPMSPIYCASKSGVIAFSQSLALSEDLSKNNIRINTLCPAFADTALVKNLFLDNSEDGKKVTGFVEKVGIMTTKEVADGLIELVTDDSKNGAILRMTKLKGKEYVSLVCQTITA